MYKLITILFLTCGYTTFAQQTIILNDSMPTVVNGISYGYTVTNERSKSIKGDEFDRFELTLFITNQSGSAKVIPLKTNLTGSVEFDNNIEIGNFNVSNATGRRLTAKGATINALPWFMNVKVSAQLTVDGKTNINAQIANAIKDAETISKKITVILPKGEKPKVSCKTRLLVTLQ